MLRFSVVFPFFISIFTLLGSYATAQQLIKRFEYKYSFKGPHLVQKDRSVPFWSYIGNAIASDDFMRVAPSLKSQRGLVWNKFETDFDNWEVELTFKVTGRGRVGADGLAFWYINDEKAMTGPVFGANDQWKGLGIFFDSFDNDAQNNNPYISAMLNDGTKRYDHNIDGSSQQLGGCMRDYRNKPYPIKARIRYENKVLMVYTSSGISRRPNDKDAPEVDRFDVCIWAKNIELPRGGHFMLSAATGAIAGTPYEWIRYCTGTGLGRFLFIHNGLSSNYDQSLFELCFRAEDVLLEKGSHFMVSGATGGLADDHDVLSFLTHSLRSETDMKIQAIKDEERLKYEEEYKEYNKKLDEAKDEYKNQNPDLVQDSKEDKNGFFDGEVRELRMIFEGQDQIFFEIRGINKRLNELLGMQERISSQISNAGGAIQQGGAAPPGNNGGAQPVMQRHEVDTLMRQTSDLLFSLQTMKQSVEDMAKQKRSADPGHGYAKKDHEMMDKLDEMSKDMSVLITRSRENNVANQGGNRVCHDVSCVSTLYFGGFIAAQIVVFLVLGYMRSRSEAAAKKFY